MVLFPSENLPLSIVPFPDSQSALVLLSMASTFLQPKFFWDIWDFSDSLSSRVALSFQWVSGHAGLPDNELADSLAKTEATLSFIHVSSPLASVIEKIRNTRYSFWRRNLSHNSLFCQIPSVSPKELALARLVRRELSRLRCHDHSLLLSSYLSGIKWNSYCSACGHPLQDLTHLLLDCPASELSDAPFLALLPFLTFGPDLGEWPDSWVSVEFLHVPIPQKGSGSTINTTSTRTKNNAQQ